MKETSKMSKECRPLLLSELMLYKQAYAQIDLKAKLEDLRRKFKGLPLGMDPDPFTTPGALENLPRKPGVYIPGKHDNRPVPLPLPLPYDPYDNQQLRPLPLPLPYDNRPVPRPLPLPYDNRPVPRPAPMPDFPLPNGPRPAPMPDFPLPNGPRPAPMPDYRSLLPPKWRVP